jgi:hypothetical protein
MATKKEKGKEILMKTKKPGLPVNIKKPSIPQSSNAMGASGTILNNVNVRPTRAQTAMHDVKTFHKEYISGTKDLLKSKNILEKAKGLAAGSIGGIMQEGMPLAMSTPALFNVISGQARYNKNKRAGFGRNFGVPNVAENRERSKGLSKSDSILAVQGKLPAVTSGRDTPLPSSDGILKNAANKVLDFIKR